MSLIEHLEALRRALIISLIAWSAGTIAAIFVAGHVITFLITRAGIGHAIYLQPGGGVLLQLKVALYIGIVLAAPVIIQQVWWFVSPGLHPHERKYVLPLVLATILFFAIGVSVAMFALTLLGVALFHHHTLPVALTGLAAIIIYKLAFTGFKYGTGVAGFGQHMQHEWVTLANLFAGFVYIRSRPILLGAQFGWVGVGFGRGSMGGHQTAIWVVRFGGR